MPRTREGGEPPLSFADKTGPTHEDADATKQERLDVVLAAVAQAQAQAQAQAHAAAQAQAQAQAAATQAQAQAHAAASHGSQEMPTYNETLIQRNPTESGALSEPDFNPDA